MKAFKFYTPRKFLHFIDYIRFEETYRCENEGDLDDPCDHSYNRCQVVSSVKKLDFDYDAFAKDVTRNQGPIALYIIDRYARQTLVLSDFEPIIQKGYYGEYVIGFSDNFNFFDLDNCATVAEQMKLILTKEYGGILPQLDQVEEWKAIEVSIKDIIPSNSRSVSDSKYLDRDSIFPIGIGISRGKKFVLLDGHHRLESALRGTQKTVQLIVPGKEK